MSRAPITRDLSQATTIIGSATNPQPELHEKMEQDNKEAIFNVMAVVGFAFSLLNFLDQQTGKKK